MPTNVSREQVPRLMEQGAQLVEVLPSAEYDEEHIAGAINIPLKKLDRASASRLRQDVPVVTYCHDFQ